MSSSSTALAVKDYAPAAASLFNNMKTPASILAGAIVPLGFLAALPDPPDDKDNVPFFHKTMDRMLRKSYLLVTLFSFGSQLLAVMWATVAVNQLTETVVEPAASVWALLKRQDWLDLAWSATNSHFVLGTSWISREDSIDI